VPNFESSKDVARWLKDKPREFAVVIGARAALRVAPMLVTSLGVRGGGVERIGRKTILPTFRGMATSWVASAWPTYSAVLRETHAASARAAGTSAAAEPDSGAAYAADAAFRAVEAAAAGARTSAVAKSANAIAAAAASAGYAAGAAVVTDASAAANAARAAVASLHWLRHLDIRKTKVRNISALNHLANLRIAAPIWRKALLCFAH
jgi:hypothetical protein